MKDCPGFLVNRLLTPYMNEAGYLLAEVDDPMEVEKAAIEFGFPMGPLELMDLVGAGVAAKVSQVLYEAYGERMQPAPAWKRLTDLQKSMGPAGASTKVMVGKGSKKSTSIPKSPRSSPMSAASTGPKRDQDRWNDSPIPRLPSDLSSRSSMKRPALSMRDRSLPRGSRHVDGLRNRFRSVPRRTSPLC